MNGNLFIGETGRMAFFFNQNQSNQIAWLQHRSSYPSAGEKKQGVIESGILSREQKKDFAVAENYAPMLIIVGFFAFDMSWKVRGFDAVLGIFSSPPGGFPRLLFLNTSVLGPLFLMILSQAPVMTQCIFEIPARKWFLKAGCRLLDEFNTKLAIWNP